jgi:hypothetical protein
MRNIPRIPFHPIAFATYPVLGLVVSNPSSLGTLEIWWLLAMAMAIALSCYALFRLIGRSARGAALLSSLFLLLFFTYGHVHMLLGRRADPTLWLCAIWIGILVGASCWLLAHPLNEAVATQALNITCLALLAPQVVTLGLRTFQGPSPIVGSACEPPGLAENMAPVQDTDALPDIYYIILDGYARSDVLDQIYNVDNTALLSFLRENGFYVADESVANYDQTYLSIPSSLNMAYIQDLQCTEAGTPFDYWELAELAYRNQTFAIAQRAGYRLVAFSSGHSLTEISTVDFYLTPEAAENGILPMGASILGFPVELTSLEVMFLDTTWLRPILPALYGREVEDPAYQARRDLIWYTFGNLAKFAQAEGHYFIFAHILAPHPPFVFQADGRPRRQWRPYSIVDGSHWVGSIGTRNDYIVGYREQLLYINKLLMDAIKEILELSEPSPVIILQGDHGPGAFFDWRSQSRTNLEERMGILNAYHFPGGDGGRLYPAITPVNSLRIVFNRYLGQDFKLLDERSYYSKWSDPYDFVDVTESLR